VSTEAARLIALELFHENKVSLGRAAELCQTPLAKFMEFAADHGISPLRYTDAELEEDRRTLRRTWIVIVVSNSSPLISLAKIGAFDLFQRFYGK
jgi:predicted HTH domain antitoxin